MFVRRTPWGLLGLSFKPGRPRRRGFRGGHSFPVRVVSVQDGDSLTVRPLERNSEVLRVRLYGIDAPEHDQDFGREARDRLSSLVRGRSEFTLEPKDTDRYGRLVGVLYFRSSGQSHSVNRILVEEGLAWWYSRYGGGELGLEQAERNARRARRGLWGAGKQFAPWDHRRAQRQTAASRRQAAKGWSLLRTLLLATVISVGVVVLFYMLRQAL